MCSSIYNTLDSKTLVFEPLRTTDTESSVTNLFYLHLSD